MSQNKSSNPVGRPREHDRDEIANEMLEWVKNEESVNLNQFCCTREPPLSPSMVLLWSKECTEFRRAYEKTKAYIGFRREKRLNEGKLHVKAFDLNATVYDLFTKEDRREHAKYESDLKSQEALTVNAEDSKRFDSLVKKLESLQSDARNIADSSKITDAKS